MKNIICEKCRKPVALSDKFCGNCGSKFLNDFEEYQKGGGDLSNSFVPDALLERAKDLKGVGKISIDVDYSQDRYFVTVVQHFEDSQSFRRFNIKDLFGDVKVKVLKQEFASIENDWWNLTFPEVEALGEPFDYLTYFELSSDDYKKLVDF